MAKTITFKDRSLRLSCIHLAQSYLLSILPVHVRVANDRKRPLRLESPERFLDESFEELHLVDVVDGDRPRRIITDDFRNLLEHLLLRILK